jgi:glycosyltransferase involved in cell wall biosynthesis
MSPSALFVTTVPITLEAFLLPFSEQFRSRGWRIDALTKGATQYPAILNSFDTLYDIAWSRNPLAVSDHFDTWARVRRIVIEGGYDIVHVHTPIAAFVTRFALRSMAPADRPVVIYTAHGFHFYEGQGFLGHTIFSTMERRAAPWTDYLVTINEEDFAAAQTFRGIAPERVRLIPGIGVDVTAYSREAVAPGAAEEIRRELDIADDAFMLTMVAEFSPVKRHEHLLQALALVRDQRVVLVFAGAGDIEDTIRARVTELGLEARVRWAGYRRDIPALLAASDALTLVSAREGLPRSVLEAMAMGVPVIGTRTRGIIDAIGSDAGWLVPKTDVRELAAAIDAASADPDAVLAAGQAALERARTRFSLDDVLGAYEALYTEALEQRRNG